ncbi:hypothetical protein [Pseudothauera lacus]|uniref:Uncharacterized protein n=1 Tax=Pseudothauera lacus TaxID=2136175 RepID=A0A2T4IDN2_9RHOO|nr:hypothetical protein [Pseudothauera lacus]PTD95836.1 hypothetical protein C8261_12625 [Pseudothauera lacus]
MSREFFVDGGLLEPGNKLAVRTMAKYALRSISEDRRTAQVRHDDALDWLEAALAAIAAGKEPNQAFGWSQSRRGNSAGNHALRDWEIKMAVRDRMRETGESKTVACENVSSDCDGEVPLKAERIKEICKGVTADSELPQPTDIFPINPTAYQRE